MQCPDCGAESEILATRVAGAATLVALLCRNGHVTTTATIKEGATFKELSDTLVEVAGIPGPERRLVKEYVIPLIESALKELATTSSVKASLSRRRLDLWERKFLEERISDPY